SLAAVPSRSRRAIREACKGAGTARDGGGLAARMASRSPGTVLSRAALVKSSTKSGTPVGALVDFTDQLAREPFGASKILARTRPFGPAQPIEGQRREIGRVAPGRLEFRTEGDDERDRQA